MLLELLLPINDTRNFARAHVGGLLGPHLNDLNDMVENQEKLEMEVMI